MILFSAGIYVIVSEPAPVEHMDYEKRHAFSDQTSYSGMWISGKLKYIVFIPREITVETRSSRYYGMPILATGITIIPEGLFYNGKRITTTPQHNIFVIQSNNNLCSLNLGPFYHKFFNISNIMKLEDSIAWLEIKDIFNSVNQVFYEQEIALEINARLFLQNKIKWDTGLRKEDFFFEHTHEELELNNNIWDDIRTNNMLTEIKRGGLINDGRNPGSAIGFIFNIQNNITITIGKYPNQNEWQFMEMCDNSKITRDDLSIFSDNNETKK
ncbi:MAG: hypothetical protein HRU15_18210 [Planctomycetes bacterium]|nr:hypothetical protein [Planctomycetota bacterium]